MTSQNSKQCTREGCRCYWTQKLVCDTRKIFLFSPKIFRGSAGQDATEAFFGLHRYEVLARPQYQRLKIGIVEGETPYLHGRVAGELSRVPYGEPTWLSAGYHSPYYTEV